MLDVEERVREMLRRRAADVPPHAKAPPGMLRRAWRRIVVAFTGGVVAVAILAGAARGVEDLAARGRKPRPSRSQEPTAAVRRRLVEGSGGAVRAGDLKERRERFTRPA